MLAKMTSKNQLTPVRIKRGDAVRAKLAELDLNEQDVADAVAWTRKTPVTKKLPHLKSPANNGRLSPLRHAWQGGVPGYR